MGTSKAYGSPKWPGVNSAVGSAASVDPTTEKLAKAIGVFAGAYKAHLSSGIITPGSSSRSGAAAGRSNRSGVSGLGRGNGGGGASRSRAASEGSRLANFISSAQQSGFQSAVSKFGLDRFIDKPLGEFLDAMANRLAGEGGILDDDVLDRAMSDTLNELAEDAGTVEEFDELLGGGLLNIEEVLQTYYGNVLFNHFEQKEYAIVREKLSNVETKQFFKQARTLIRAIVRDELAAERDLTQIDWATPDGQQIADSINQEVMEILIP